ncbi:hypothetical protein [Catelliglobosispora koreensis]|uniref:hypothetical protein n=1 Tax=Catelliglobosispora koreensis TaxID=129052 RepID=UPI0004756982|nr:hypothetical protein [Catelliglobosispora koreensis]
MVATLRAWLAGVSFTGKDQAEVTALLTDAIVRWGETQGWRVYLKARSVFPLPPPYADKFSHVDVAFAREGLPPVVVEIDRSARQRTLDKLLAEAQAGRIAIWVRWGEGPFEPPPAPVEMVPVTVLGRGKYATPPPERPAPEHSEADLGDADQMEMFPPPS